MAIKYLPFGGAALAAAFLAAAPTPAQESVPTAAAPVQDAAAPAATACEFHVWPADPVKWAQQDGMMLRSVNRPVYREGAPNIPVNPVDAAAQIEVMTLQQPQQLFGKADYRLVVHDAPLPSMTIRGATGRLSDSASACYAELIVDDIVIQQDVVSGSRLRTLFHYRDFGDGAAPRRTFSTWGEVDLAAFPPRHQAQYDMAMSELRSAFRNTIQNFAVYAGRPPRPRR